ncbi:signal recognition particle-docking protein FtsY [Methanococcoides sp. LMO-2]|uniref:Signal recognition particle receptor FtsY n=1 Tax=Methanococcoides cohabitans TaxID=3136559 RepID=A0ABU9KRU1_9EURY
MFNKLKDKLNNFKQSIGKTIDEKAVDLEEPIVESVEESIGETTEAPIEDTMVEEVTEVVKEVPAEPVKVAAEPSTQGQSDVPESQPEKKASFKQKIGFAQKAKALVFEREVILDEDDISDALWELEMALLESDIAITVAEAIVEAVKDELVGSRKKIGSNTGELVEQALRNAIYNVMAANVFDLDEYIEKADKPVHIVFIGINGTGKTTTISKMAKRLKDMNYSVVIAAGDTFRAGAIDQIAIHAERIGVKLIKHQEGGDPAAVVYDAVQHAKANNADVILSDTAGRMHTNVNLMAQLEKVCRVSTPDLIIFVDEAVAGNDAVERAEQFNSAVPIDGSILTKTDADSKGGAAISIAYITGKPILFLGMGQGYDDLQKFDPKWFVDQLFE